MPWLIGGGVKMAKWRICQWLFGGGYRQGARRWPWRGENK